jgi:hypothetical protein
MALLAAEDADFYGHRGLDYPGLLRALVVNIRRGTIAQGASTITQQVVKNVLLTPSARSLARCARCCSRGASSRSSARTRSCFCIVNHINFGHGRYGVEEAARFYFGKHARELTLGECALLAGIAEVSCPILTAVAPRGGAQPPSLDPRADGGEAASSRSDQADVAAAEPVRLAATVARRRQGTAPEVVDARARARSRRSRAKTPSAAADTPSTRPSTRRSSARRGDAVQRVDCASSTRARDTAGPFVAPGARRPRPSRATSYDAERAPRDGTGCSPGTNLRRRSSSAPRRSRAEEIRGRGCPGTSGSGRADRARARGPPPTRYAQSLTPSQFAPAGATVRVSVPTGPHHPRSARARCVSSSVRRASLVAIEPVDPRARSRWSAPTTPSPGCSTAPRARSVSPGSAFKPFRVLLRGRLAALHPRERTVDPNPGCFGAGRTDDGAPPRPTRTAMASSSLALRLREALAFSRATWSPRGSSRPSGPRPSSTHAHAPSESRRPIPTDLTPRARLRRR